VTIALGSHHTLSVLRRTRLGLHLGANGEEILLPTRHVPPGVEVGDDIRVFVHADSDDTPIATTQTPLATVGDFACLRVVDVSEHGAFLDWGLEKDLFVPFKMQHRRMVRGERHVVAVYLDERSNRVVASGRLGPFFDYDLSSMTPGRAVSVMVYDFTDRGALVIVDRRYSGMLYANETFEKLRVGDETTAYVRRVRADNKLDLACRLSGRDGFVAAQETILARLHADGGVLALNDKSSPEEIAAALAMSKKAFKKAVGGLYKARKIELTDTGVRLLPDAL